MNTLKLLIVDDDADNRLILHAICKKFENVEIEEAEDGQEAVDVVELWKPHIVLMDVMMPRMDGFEASKLIKAHYPETVIIVVSAALDDNILENFSRIGIEIFIHKPIDRELIRFKLQSVAAILRLKQGDMIALSKKDALNPFNTDIRSFKTVFDIAGPEAMMDFGMWLLDQFSGKVLKNAQRLDCIVELFYKLMNRGKKLNEAMQIVIEESFEEFYITIVFEQPIVLEDALSSQMQKFGIAFEINGTMFCIRLDKALELTVSEPVAVAAPKPVETAPAPTDTASTKDKKRIDENEKGLLKQSFTVKTSAEDYVGEIGGDVIDEILELESIDSEWADQLHVIEDAPTVENLVYLSDNVLNAYVRVINNLFEFTALAYALSSLGVFIKDSAESIIEDPKKLKTLIMLLEHLLEDLSSWREHIFILKDTADIHYLDSSFFSSCMQIEMLISNKDLVVAGDEDDDNDMEFF